MKKITLLVAIALQILGISITSAMALDANSISVGDYVTFGHYPQTASGTDNTPIEWQVLEVQDNKALLISRYALDVQQYNNSTRSHLTWQECALRTWLNKTFLQKAFSNGEQNGILMTNVDNSKSQGYSGYSTNSGNNTQDKVFLLSYAEAWQYFQDDNARKCMPTEYALQQRPQAYTFDGKTTCRWWLRSPGYYQYHAITVLYEGSASGSYVENNKIAVRPAIWVNLVVIMSEPEEPQRAKDTATEIEENSYGIIEGDYVAFGRYPQKAGGTDNTPIEWQVLDVQGNKALLISRYALDCQKFDSSYVDTTWEECTLRTWLNGKFLIRAFTDNEQRGILKTNVVNGKSYGYSGYNTNGGTDTQDKVFLLSYAEAWKYFKDDNARMCAPTEYAVKQGAWTSSKNKVWGKATCEWWLRSPGVNQSTAIHVKGDGSCGYFYVYYSGYAVRPALWVNLDIIKLEITASNSVTDNKIDSINASVGDYITFGHYPQTASGTDNTSIEWKVLDVQGNKALLISRYALETQEYNYELEDITWEKCTLRTWLNRTFLKEAFSSSEQKGILTTNVDNSKSQGYSGYSTYDSNSTQDKVFLLSYAEAWKYFHDDNARMCVPTEYAVKQGAYESSSYTVGGETTCDWWLRSPGLFRNFAAIVYLDGSRDNYGVECSYITIRPAIWVDFDVIMSEPEESQQGSDSAVDNHDVIVPEPEVPLSHNNAETSSEENECGITVGDYIVFGHYPQTANGMDNTPIEWLVLDVQENKALLISRYALDCYQYNSRDASITWQDCTLRTWLNRKFLNKAFTSSEQEGIMITNVDNSECLQAGEWYAEKDCNNTQDKVFLLSDAETWRYFKKGSARMCVPTEYAVKQGAYTNKNYTVGGKVTCLWWLRTLGSQQVYAYTVTGNGNGGFSSVNTSGAVRPVLWVNLNSGVF